jgi:prefoldin alpha subunit
MSQPQQVSVTDLDVSQLADVRRQLEEVTLSELLHRDNPSNRGTQELNHLTNSFAQLKQAQAKFKACIENVAEIKPANKGSRVPLSSSYATDHPCDQAKPSSCH